MIEASFDAKRSSEAAIRGAYQYDTGQRLKMYGLPSPEELARQDDFLSGSEVAVQVQYGFLGDAQTEMRLALYDREEGAWRAEIPDLYLSKSVPVHVYVYVSYGSTEKEGRAKTCYEAVFTPEGRPAPSSRVTPSQVNAWNTLVIEVNMTLAEMNRAISGANASAAEANTARDQAKEAAGTANQSAVRADAARDAANGAAASANGAAGSANAAAAGANVAAGTAEKAAGTAGTAAQQARTAAAGADKAAERIETLSVKASTNQPGTDATASLREENGRRVLLLGIPQGLKGETGERGERGETGAQGLQGKSGIDGVFTSASAYSVTTCIDYSSREGTVSWSDSEIKEHKGAAWKKGNHIILVIRCQNGDQYMSYQEVADYNVLNPISYWVVKKGDKGPAGVTFSLSGSTLTIKTY